MRILTTPFPTPVSRACEGALVGSGIPLVWVAWRMIQGAVLPEELANAWPVYAYMLAAGIVGFACFGWKLGRYEARLEALSVRDPLTKLYNSWHFHEQLEQHCDYVRERGGNVGMLLIDLDHFKTLNDRFGHPAGDKILVGIAQCLRENVRAHDTVARVGGEEFIVLMRDCERDKLSRAAERIREAVAASPLPEEARSACRVTASVGSAELQGEEADAEKLYQRADEALYAAKAAGRNRVWAAADLIWDRDAGAYVPPPGAQPGASDTADASA